MSNFHVLQDPETDEVELYLTRLGEDPDDLWGADLYKYVLRLRA